MMLDWLLNESLVLVLALALLLDVLYPYHKGVLLKAHPVHTCYMLAIRLARPYSSRLRGVLIWLVCTTCHLAPYTMLLYLSWRACPLLWILVSAWTLKVSISIKLLLDIAYNVYRCAASHDYSVARYWTQQIVRRDVYKLSEKHVLSAAIESLAESLCDGFVSPLFYFAFLGAPGALLQRLVNTLDGAIGYKTSELKDVGWLSAKADTVMNYVPARLTALYIIVAGGLLGYSVRDAVKVWRRDSRRTESVNAGHPISAIAGVLKVRLEKPGFYSVGDDVRRMEPNVVLEAIRVVKVAAAIHVAVVMASAYLISHALLVLTQIYS